MIYNGRIEPGMTRRQNEYSSTEGPRFSVKRVYYPWKQSPVGLAGLGCIYLYSKQYASDDQFLLHPPGKLGVRFDQMLVWIKEHYPRLLHDHALVAGEPLRASKLAARFANMYRFNKPKGFGFGPEHPKNHPQLRRAVEGMERLQRQRGFSVTALHDYVPPEK